MAQVHHEIRERPPIKILPRTEVERCQQIIAFDDEYNQLCNWHSDYDTENINCLPVGQEILQQMEIMEGLAGKFPNYIQIKLLGTHHYSYVKNWKEIIKDFGYIIDDDDDASAAMLEDTTNDEHTLDCSDTATTCPIMNPPTTTNWPTPNTKKTHKQPKD